MHFPEHLQKLIETLKRFPGVGNKTAERFAFQLLNWPQQHLYDFSDLIKTLKAKVTTCAACGCLMGEEGCFFCESNQRDCSLLCVVASPRDVFSVEETREYKGLYHVLGGVLSPLEGKGPEVLSLQGLKERLSSLGCAEVIIALDSSLEGDATALYLKQELESFPIKISRLAFGLPMGSAIDYVDGGTLARAFSGRRQF